MLPVLVTGVCLPGGSSERARFAADVFAVRCSPPISRRWVAIVVVKRLDAIEALSCQLLGCNSARHRGLVQLLEKHLFGAKPVVKSVTVFRTLFEIKTIRGAGDIVVSRLANGGGVRMKECV